MAQRDHECCRVGKFDHPLSEHGRKKIRLWQAACSLVAFVPEEDTQDVIFQIFDMLTVRAFAKSILLWPSSESEKRLASISRETQLGGHLTSMTLLTASAVWQGLFSVALIW